ncbi:Na+/H+ antiporter NhaA [Nocardioides sp.]|uniref:Na+/H+ antiporter NhaA n=1 Tax=Nocardioides sp. TaxID=35761 RepID=UPI0035286B2D
MSDTSFVRRFFPDLDPRERSFLGDLFRQETVGGALALIAAAVALVWANVSEPSYDSLRHFLVGPLDLEHWAAEGALTLFFFVAGLELKREFVVGSLRRPADAAVPVVAAISGVAVPALVYLAVNAGGETGGWAIPAATDIAFALAVLAVVGSNLPTSLRAFLLTMAVVDDPIVVIIIATFFTEEVHLLALAGGALALAAYGLGQRLRWSSPLVFVPLAVAAWWGVHEAGIHATIAGVALGLLTRVRRDEGEEHSPAEHLEHLLAPVSSGVAVPAFALLTAGVPLSGGADLVRDPVVLGVVAGLLLGKPIGVLLGAWSVTRFTHAELNPDLAWRDLFGVAILAGIGFTVSLLVSDLAFAGDLQEAAKVGVLAGSRSMTKRFMVVLLVSARRPCATGMTPASFGPPAQASGEHPHLGPAVNVTGGAPPGGLCAALIVVGTTRRRTSRPPWT